MVFGLFKKKPSPVSWFEGSDDEMLKAIRESQSSIGSFIAAIEEENRRVVPAFDAALVKYAFPATKQGVKVEHIFLSDVTIRGNQLSGIVNDAPRYTDEVKEGDVVAIDTERVSDWLYVVNGVGTGGYTFRVMWKKFTEAERAGYGQHPPFAWLPNL